MGSDDYDTGLLCALILLVPSIIVFTALNVLRIRRSKFNRQRIYRPSEKSSTTEKSD